MLEKVEPLHTYDLMLLYNPLAYAVIDGKGSHEMNQSLDATHIRSAQPLDQPYQC